MSSTPKASAPSPSMAIPSKLRAAERAAMDESSPLKGKQAEDTCFTMCMACVALIFMVCGGFFFVFRKKPIIPTPPYPGVCPNDVSILVVGSSVARGEGDVDLHGWVWRLMDQLQLRCGSLCTRPAPTQLSSRTQIVLREAKAM